MQKVLNGEKPTNRERKRRSDLLAGHSLCLNVCVYFRGKKAAEEEETERVEKTEKRSERGREREGERGGEKAGRGEGKREGKQSKERPVEAKVRSHERSKERREKEGKERRREAAENEPLEIERPQHKVHVCTVL